jgi:hypothetical protein
MRHTFTHGFIIYVALIGLGACSHSTAQSGPDLSNCSNCGDGAAATASDLAGPRDLAGGVADLAMPATGDMSGHVCHFNSAACNHNAVCPGAPGGCCAQGEWCENGTTCRCGANPPCAATAVCSSGPPPVNGCGMTCCPPPGCP